MNRNRSAPKKSAKAQKYTTPPRPSGKKAEEDTPQPRSARDQRRDDRNTQKEIEALVEKDRLMTYADKPQNNQYDPKRYAQPPNVYPQTHLPHVQQDNMSSASFGAQKKSYPDSSTLGTLNVTRPVSPHKFPGKVNNGVSENYHHSGHFQKPQDFSQPAPQPYNSDRGTSMQPPQTQNNGPAYSQYGRDPALNSPHAYSRQNQLYRRDVPQQSMDQREHHPEYYSRQDSHNPGPSSFQNDYQPGHYRENPPRRSSGPGVIEQWWNTFLANRAPSCLYATMTGLWVLAKMLEIGIFFSILFILNVTIFPTRLQPINLLIPNSWLQSRLVWGLSTLFLLTIRVLVAMTTIFLTDFRATLFNRQRLRDQPNY